MIQKQVLRQAREVITLKTALVLFTIVVGISSAGVYLFVNSQQTLDVNIRQNLLSTVQVAAAQFTGEELDALRKAEDVNKPEHQRIVDRLQGIRLAVPHARYVYILRERKDSGKVEFVADADSMLSFAELDTNSNGIIERNEEAALPGQRYDVSGEVILQGEAFRAPAVSKDFIEDQWGVFLSGFAPIYYKDGTTVAATLGIDITVKDYLAMKQSIMSVYGLITFIIAGVILALAVLLFLWKRRITMLLAIEDEQTSLLKLTLHQLGTPITILRWSIESIRDVVENTKIGKAIEDDMLSLEECLHRLSHVNEVLVMADRIKGGGLEIEQHATSVLEVFTEIQASQTKFLSAKHQGLNCGIEEDLHLLIDKKLITTVLNEVLKNAHIYAPENSEITLLATTRDGDAVLSVTDNGCGIPKKDMPRIFDRFFRGSNAGKFDTDGTGFGLYICKGIIEHAGGTLSVYSKEGEGTKVEIVLPAKC